MSKKNENQVIVTRSGYESLTAELTQLRTVRRQEVAKQLEEARAFGDLSENAEYAAAKEEQSKVEGRILELETMLGKITIVDEEKLDTGKVSIGLTVTLEDLDAPGKSYTYTLVGSEELSSSGGAPSQTHRISQKSPVGQAILGHVAGDEVVVKIPHGTRHLRIAEISRGDKRDKDKAENTPKGAQPKPPAKPKSPAKPKTPPKAEVSPKTEEPPKEPSKTAAASNPKKEKKGEGKPPAKSAPKSTSNKPKGDSTTEPKPDSEAEPESDLNSDAKQ